VEPVRAPDVVEAPKEATSTTQSPGPGARRSRALALGVGLGLVAVVVLLVGLWGQVFGSDESLQAQPTVTPSLAGIAEASRLSWAPPALERPATIHADETDGAITLDPDRDYLIVMPDRPISFVGGLRIVGGRNVVLVGGEVVAPSENAAPDPRSRRGLLLKNQTGTVHVEGLRISGDDLSEGINLDQSLGATVQLENISVTTVHGTRESNHADVLQTWAGPSKLRIDGLQGSTVYQGLFLLPKQFVDAEPVSFDLRRIVLTSAGKDGTAGYLLWTHDDAPWLTTEDIRLVDTRSDLGRLVRPASQWVSGISLETSSAGAKLPAGTPGIGYVTPGYKAVS
jgi:hypothetical protein